MKSTTAACVLHQQDRPICASHLARPARFQVEFAILIILSSSFKYIGASISAAAIASGGAAGAISR
jgi:hypothetical protein